MGATDRWDADYLEAEARWADELADQDEKERRAMITDRLCGFCGHDRDDHDLSGTCAVRACDCVEFGDDTRARDAAREGDIDRLRGK